MPVRRAYGLPLLDESYQRFRSSRTARLHRGTYSFAGARACANAIGLDTAESSPLPPEPCFRQKESGPAWLPHLPFPVDDSWKPPATRLSSVLDPPVRRLPQFVAELTRCLLLNPSI